VNTVDLTSTASLTSTIDVTVTQTVSTTTTTTIASTATSAATCGVNVVSNPNFGSSSSGTSLSPWTYSSSGNGKYAFVAGVNTPYAIDLYSSSIGTSTSMIKQVIPTVDGKTYTFSLYYLVSGGNAASNFQISYDNTNSNYYTINIGASVKAVWRTYQSTFVASSSSTTMTLKLTTLLNSAVYIDNVSVVTSC
jgi:hypothetical protein